MKEFRVQCFIFPIMITGCLLSFQWNVMHYIIENSIDTQSLRDEEITKYTLLVMTVLGCCEVLGGIFIGFFNTVTPKYTSQLFQFHLISIALLLALINTYRNMEYALQLQSFEDQLIVELPQRYQLLLHKIGMIKYNILEFLIFYNVVEE